MATSKPASVPLSSLVRSRPLSVLVLIAILLVLVPAAGAQTMTVLHDFSNFTDGGEPQTGMSMDRFGTFYGVTQYGGDRGCDHGGVPGCGVLFKFKRTGSAWILTPLHQFTDGPFPDTPGVPAAGPNGRVYGVTWLGGEHSAGLIYSAAPSPTIPSSVISYWNYNPIHQFTGGDDGGWPATDSPLYFQADGSFYGAAGGGAFDEGVVYKMTPSGGGWTESIVYAFTSDDGVANPSGLVFDQDGNIYGVGLDGGNEQCMGYGCGSVFKLTHTQSGWAETTLHIFQEGAEGGWPGPLMRDAAGNLYGLTTRFGSQSGGSVWELSPSNGGWNFSVIHTFPTTTVGDYGPYGLVMDAAGSLYGITNWAGLNNTGYLFKLTPSNGDWSFSDVYDFAPRGTVGAGCYPQGTPLMDASGNLYGVAEQCGQHLFGTIWEFTP